MHDLIVNTMIIVCYSRTYTSDTRHLVSHLFFFDFLELLGEKGWQVLQMIERFR